MKETLEDYSEYNECCKEEEIKRIKEAMEWVNQMEFSNPMSKRSAHICRHYLYKRLNELGGE